MPDLGNSHAVSELHLIGFKLIPEIRALYLTDLFDNTMIFASIAYIVFGDSRPLYSFTKYFLCFSITYLLKMYPVPIDDAD